MTSTSKVAKSVRNFLYLDSDKLRSHSSQVFEGVTEYVSKSLTTGSAETKEQKGPVGSGRILGDILSAEGSSTELKFLEDYAYSLFEEKLGSDGRLQEFSQTDTGLGVEKAYVKVTARLGLNDTREVLRLIRGFNQFGEYLCRVTLQSQDAAKRAGKPWSDPEVRAKAKELGMTMDSKLAEAMSWLLEFGYQDMIEASMSAGGFLFSAPLKRDSLREDARITIQKYSRYTQSELTLLGVVTQIGKNDVEEEKRKNVIDASNLKQALRYLSVHQKTVEDTFMGQLDTDVLIDPIAIYSSI